MVSKRDKISQQRAIAAAKLIVAGETSKTIKELAEEHEVGTKSISDARILLHFGTEHEIDIVNQGHIGLNTVVNGIRERVPAAELVAYQKKLIQVSEKRRANEKAASELWSKLSLMFKGITDMPTPKDVVKHIASNHRRATLINEQLETVANWIKEFQYEWQFYQLGKHQENSSDSGGGDKAA